MATTSAVGGSQIDVQSLVSQLVAAERATPEAQIKRQSTQVTTQISALGTLSTRECPATGDSVASGLYSE